MFREAVQNKKFTITAELTIKREFGKKEVRAMARDLDEDEFVGPGEAFFNGT